MVANSSLNGNSQQSTSPTTAKAVPLSNDLHALDGAIAALRSLISGLGAALFDLEQTPALSLASGANYTGLTGQAAKQMQTALGELWLGYPKLVAVMEMVETTRGTADSLRSNDRDALRSLLVEGQTELAGNTLEAEHLRLSALLVAARHNLETIDVGFAACASTLAELDTLARSALAAAEQTGERVNEVARLAKQLGEQRLRAAADPLGWQSSSASSLATQLGAVASELGVALQTQDQLDEFVVDGQRRLDALRVLIANGIAAATKTRSRMADTDSLPAPLRVSVLDGADGLRNRLGLVGATLVDDPRKARQLWTLWDRDMTSIESNATAVFVANTKPIAERDALRGRLDGFEAKAAAAGVVEVAGLVQLHRGATALLLTPPVSLVACEAAVSAYGEAVSKAISNATSQAVSEAVPAAGSGGSAASASGSPSAAPTNVKASGTLASTKVNS